MGVAQVDFFRADLILGAAQSLCEAIVLPLPAGAEAVILDVATRAWVNPTNAQTEGTGPYHVGWGPVSGGLWLTRQNRATLRGLAHSGGAFTVDMLPATAGQSLPWWDSGVSGFLGGDGSWMY